MVQPGRQLVPAGAAHNNFSNALLGGRNGRQTRTDEAGRTVRFYKGIRDQSRNRHRVRRRNQHFSCKTG